MKKMIGYGRVSTVEQNADRQKEELVEFGIREDDIYIDHGVSGAKEIRPELEKALNALKRGDTFVITTLDRLGRSTQNMLKLAEQLERNGIALVVLNLGGGVVDTSTPMGKMLFTVMTALAEMELDIKRERILSSINSRKKKGGNLGGRPPRINDDHILGITADIEAGVSVAEACRKRGVARGSYYRKLQQQKAQQELSEV